MNDIEYVVRRETVLHVMKFMFLNLNSLDVIVNGQRYGDWLFSKIY